MDLQFLQVVILGLEGRLNAFPILQTSMDLQFFLCHMNFECLHVVLDPPSLCKLPGPGCWATVIAY